MRTYNIQQEETASGTAIVATVSDGPQEKYVLTLVLANAGGTNGYQFSPYMSQEEMAEHLWRLGVDAQFKKAAGYIGELFVCAAYNQLTGRASDFYTLYGELAANESVPLTTIDEVVVPSRFRDSLADARKTIDGEFEYAEKMFSKGEYEAAQGAIGRVKSALRRYSKGDIQERISQGRGGELYMPFDGLNDESHRYLVAYSSKRMAELKRRLEAQAAVAA
ncbi:MAG: hypothetical protein HYT72_04840 [Candidatus Aenigmarchaeota archaeon]|nr:hypothetical protein [Candidatus Aenigmarchaeota archaeon]